MTYAVTGFFMLGPMSWLTRLGFVSPGGAGPTATLLGEAAAGDAARRPGCTGVSLASSSATCWRWAATKALALDAMQDAFVELLRAPAGFNPNLHPRRLPGRHRPPPLAGALPGGRAALSKRRQTTKPTPLSPSLLPT